MTMPVSTAQLVAMMQDARQRTLDLVDGLTAEQLMGPKMSGINPLHWEIGHIAYWYEYFITRYFGSERVQLLAGLFFSLFVNLSILILIINFLIRLKKSDVFNIMAGLPLLVYFPFSINKIFLVISRFGFIFS